MADEYNFKSIEAKWQKKWQAENYGKSEDFAKKPKHYHLVEFPYPSGAGLHVGHCMGYGASDAYCRMKRMQGFNVMYPIGWDAFGLPTENYAIKHKIKPQKATEDNVLNFKKQMNSLGYAFDWSREVNTTDPDYYKWTQWIFLQFYKHAVLPPPLTPPRAGGENSGLVEVADDDTTTPRMAFQAEMPVNWCPSCKTILANEEVIAGNCERCGAQTEKRKQKQWMLRITAYADRLIKDLDTVDYLEKIKTQQVNWIGKSVGTNIKFEVKGFSNTVHDEEIEVFTTRADTLFGCTYVVVSPEHPLIEKLGHHIQNFQEIKEYVKQAKSKSDLERTELQKDKTGVKLYGVYAINPINNEKVDIWVADYVLASYGTGAVMAVPAHDERDWEFAKKHNIAIKQVIMPVFGKEHGGEEERHVASAVVKNSKGEFLTVKWTEFDWISPVVGGIEEGEDPLETMEREVFEETGYKVKAIEPIGGVSKLYFYADHKKVWRVRYDQPILCELIDEKQYSITEEEKKIQTPIWLSEKEVLDKITHEDNKVGYKRYFNGNYANTDYGVLTNSDGFDGLDSATAKEKIIERLKGLGAGDFAINFKLRDWIFSRQHYWGEPIPIIYCRNCWEELRSKNKELSESGNFTIINGNEHMIVPVPEDQLPVTLPEVENYEPTDTGESPLAKMTDWVNTTCPKCGGKAKRETDTMPNWAGSSWYYLAYALSQKSKVKSSKNLFDSGKEELKYWLPVDIYNGGMEHTTLHLLYSRFWHKFLYDLGAVPTLEPYAKRIAHGIILGPDGRKMSKSFGNVINPDDIAGQYGADTLRAYIMFIGPYDQESAWSTAGVQGVFRFLRRVWGNRKLVKESPTPSNSPSGMGRTAQSLEDSKELLVKLNQTIAGLTDDMENFRMNTVISKLMELNNTIEKIGSISKESYSIFLRLLFPATPHIASELWQMAGFENELELQSWPKADSKYLIAEEIEIVVQINGKVRDRIAVSSNINDEELKELALSSVKAKEFIAGKEIIKTIVVPKKLVSIVTK